ncbi:MAG: PEP-CTERM sorting domain-containing protein [Bryobacteraceae bacterium]|jgi:hypothetical protein
MRLRTFCVLAVAVAGMATHCEAGIIYTAPPSLAPGSPYRLAFVTDGTYEAISSNIGDYNNDVAAEAALSALSALGTTWKVIGSTASVSAISNIGSDPGVPIYDLHGNLVADDATTSPGGLFAGEPLLSPIAFTPTGASLSSIAVSTGTHPDGTPHATAELGSSYSIVIYGMITTWAGGWIERDIISTQTPAHLYGISDVLEAPAAVPEPTTSMMLPLAGALMIGVRRRLDHRKNRAKRTHC